MKRLLGTFAVLLVALTLFTMRAEAANTDWMSGKYGLFITYLPYASNISDFNAEVANFNTTAFSNQAAQSGAGYVVFTIGQNGYFCSPNNTLNGRCGLVTSSRDLISDLATALAAKNIKLIVYMPSGAPSVMAAGTGYSTSSGTRQAAFQQIWQTQIAEYSNRWGSKIAGWFFDGCYDWQDMYAFSSAPNFQSFAAAAKSGNPSSVVCFNDGYGPYSNHSQYGDYTAGEIHDPNQSLAECEGRWVNGADPATGNAFQLQWAMNTFLGSNFAGGANGPNDSPRFSNSYVSSFVNRVCSSGGTTFFDVPIHDGGGNDPNPSLAGNVGANFMPQLQAIAASLSANVTSPGRNVGLNMPSTASNSFPGSTTSSANDGNPSSFWCSAADSSTTKWWEVDLGSPQVINAAQLIFNGADSRNFLREEIQIQASNDPYFGSYSLLGFETDSYFLPSGSDFYVFPTTPVDARYIRVTRPPNDPSWNTNLLEAAEVRIYSGSGTSSSPTPYFGSPIQITSTGSTTIEAENYDFGGEGVAYHSAYSSNPAGSTYRNPDNVAIYDDPAAGNGHGIGWTTAGEWQKYTVSIATAGSYNIAIKISSAGAISGALQVNDTNGANLTGPINVPNSSGWSNYIATTPVAVTLTAGVHVFQIYLDQGGFNIDTMIVTPAVPAAPTGLSAVSGSAQVSLAWSANSTATSYNVYRNNVKVNAGVVNSPSYIDTGLTSGTTYTYAVTAVNSAGESAKSSSVSATPITSVGVTTFAQGQFLAVGQYIVSPSKNCFLIQQSDGNLVLYKGSGPNDNRGGIWAALTASHPVGSYFTVLQTDGNLCIYEGTGPNDNRGFVWCSVTQGPDFLQISDNVQLQVIGGNSVLWQAP